jgi:Eukaryotic initiation factor 4E
MNFSAAVAPTISSTKSSNTTVMTGSILHTPFVFSYMRRGGGGGNNNNSNKKASTSVSSTDTTTTAPTATVTATDNTKTTTTAVQTSTDPTTATATQQLPVAAATTTPGQQQQQHHPAVYETSIRTIRQVNTIESFWETYDYLKRPNDLPPHIDYHFFRCVNNNNNSNTFIPIKPTWEDVCCCCFLVRFLLDSLIFNPCVYVLFVLSQQKLLISSILLSLHISSNQIAK